MVFTGVCCWHLDTRLTEVVLYFLVKLLCLVKYSFPLFCFVWLINCSLCAKNNKTHNKPPWVIATWLLPNVWCIWVAAILNYHQIVVSCFTYRSNAWDLNNLKMHIFSISFNILPSTFNDFFFVVRQFKIKTVWNKQHIIPIA